METKLVETEKDLRIRIEELKSERHEHEIDMMTLRKELRKLQRIVDGSPCINEEQYLQEIVRQRRINAHLLDRLKDRGAQFRCNWCGSIKKKASIWYNEKTREILFLCFSACMKFPEPFRETKAGDRGWIRIDPWQDYKKELPRLRKDYGHEDVATRGKQTRLGEQGG